MRPPPLSVLLFAWALAACGTTVSSGSGGAGGAACAGYAESPSVQPITVHVANHTAADVYIGDANVTCSHGLGFSLADSAGQPQKPWLDLCDEACKSLQTGACGCPTICAAPLVVLIEPGGSYDIAWPGSVFVSEDMPAACFSDPTCAGACFVEKAPPAGALTFSAFAWSQLGECQNPPCSCTPDASGSCEIQGFVAPTGTKTEASAVWTTGGTVEIVFE